MSKPFRFGSVCSGIEAASVAWRKLGWDCQFVSEIEPFPCAVLNHHYPEVPNFGDFTSIQSDAGPIDLLVGGTPCQGNSLCGYHKGFLDERSSLAIQFIRLAERLHPEWVVWENVVGVLSANGGRDFGTFLGKLEELGYVGAYRTLDAYNFGVPQSRRRVFVVAHLGNQECGFKALFEQEGLRESDSSREGGEKDASLGSLGGVNEGGIGGRAISFTDRGREHGRNVEYVVERAYCLKVGKGGSHASTRRIMTPEGVLRRLTVIECERLMGFPDGYTNVLFKGKPVTDGHRHAAIGNSMAVPVMEWIGRRIQAIRLELQLAA